jgi:hypothetical protein
MTMATNLSEVIEAAMRDGEQLVAWAEPNSAACEDPREGQAVLRALGGDVPPELAIGVPLLRFADTDVPAVPLVQAVINDTRHSPTVCDLCGKTAKQRSILDRLLVPAGASVVAVHACWACKATFNCAVRYSSLVWD